MCIGCGDGAVVELVEVQMEGKKRMGAAEFLRGYQVRSGERLGYERTGIRVRGQGLAKAASAGAKGGGRRWRRGGQGVLGLRCRWRRRGLR